ncbi:MAG: hypothetical protein SGBAC_013165, partial [Bacillariaceae sp.]
MTKQRKTSRIPISDEKLQHVLVLLELGEKLRRMRAAEEEDRNKSQRHSSSRRHRRSSTRNIEGSDFVLNELEEKMERMRHSKSTSGRKPEGSGRNSRRHSSSSSNDVRNHSSRASSSTHSDTDRRRHHRSRSSGSSQDSANSKSRRVASGDDESTASSTSNHSGSLPDLATIDSEVSASEVAPGAYCVSSVGHVSLPSSSSLHGSSHGDREVVDGDDSIPTNSMSSGTFRSISTTRSGTTFRSNTIGSTLGPVSEELVAAEVAPDFENELEEARQQGREEALNDLAEPTAPSEVAVAVATDDDNERKGSDNRQDRRTLGRLVTIVLLVGVLILATGVTAATLLFGGSSEAPAQLGGNEEESNAKVVVVYTPPTQEECERIANGTILDDQLSLIHKSFYIHYDITLASEDDFDPLLSAILKYVQEMMIPIMAGCGAIDFFGTTIEIDDGLKNATDSVVSGQVAKESEQSCNRDLSGRSSNCRSYILLLDLYLKEEQSNSTLIEVIGNAVNGDEIAKALGSEYPLEAVDIFLIEPVYGSLSPSVAPSFSGLVTAAPTLDRRSEPSISTSTATPSTGVPVSPRVTPGPSKMPFASVPVTIEPADSDQTSSTSMPSLATTTPPSKVLTPIPMEGSSTNSPTTNPTRSATPPPTFALSKAPTRNPSRQPTRFPSASLVLNDSSSNPPSQETVATKSPTESPSSSPSTSPSTSPTPVPTQAPTLAPTLAPTSASSKAPTSIPSKVPSPLPTVSPTSQPSQVPTKAPTKAPSPPPTPGPTIANPAPWCCSLSFTECDMTAGCNIDQFA